MGVGVGVGVGDGVGVDEGCAVGVGVGGDWLEFCADGAEGEKQKAKSRRQQTVNAKLSAKRFLCALASLRETFRFIAVWLA